jgi:hypothetical protein
MHLRDTQAHRLRFKYIGVDGNLSLAIDGTTSYEDTIFCLPQANLALTVSGAILGMMQLTTRV